MKGIKDQIKKNQYYPVYLLCGSETYLRRLYTSKLREGALGGGDEMNVSTFYGKDVDWNEVRALAETLPFFAEHRVILLENTGAFKNACDFADVVPTLPDSVVIVFNESEVDKRTRMYKAVKASGYICEMNSLSDGELSKWIVQLLAADQKKITQSDLAFLLERIGTDMDNISTEVEKLVCYTDMREVITREDILAITTEQISGKIFAMTDALGTKNKSRALSLYHDLLLVREKPLNILHQMIRQLNLILQASEMNRQGVDRSSIASVTGMPAFAVGKCLTQARNFTSTQLLSLVSYGTELEEKVKTGRLDEHMAAEIFLLSTIS